jgi:acyl carrier protein
VFAPKVTGVRVLQEVLADQPLDFVALFSSLSVVAGGSGNSSYVSANAFLDAVANSANASAKVVSINWPTWRETGMAMAATLQKGPGSLPPTVLRHGIRTVDGIRALEQILQSNLRQVVVAPVADEAPVLQFDPSPSVVSSRASNGTEPTLAGLWQRLLGVNTVRREDSFFELGGHSLLALQLLSRIRESFGVTLSLHDVFESPKLANLSAMIESAMSSRCVAHKGKR